MLGAIAGDIIGSVHEFRAPKSTEFPLFTPQSTFTDDTILTIAVAEWILDGRDLVQRFHEMVARYPAAGWGLMFARWARAGKRGPYGSFGNGAAMRVSAAGWAAGTLEAVLETARRSAVVTHEIGEVRQQKAGDARQKAVAGEHQQHVAGDRADQPCQDRGPVSRARRARDGERDGDDE